MALQKLAYSNILKILQPKKEIFQIKNSDTFHISAQNIDYGYSLEPPRLYKKWGLRGSKLRRRVFVMEKLLIREVKRRQWTLQKTKPTRGPNMKKVD